MSVKVEFERQIAEALLIMLERRLETIQEIERAKAPSAAVALENEREVLIPSIVALEVALKIAPHQ